MSPELFWTQDSSGNWQALWSTLVVSIWMLDFELFVWDIVDSTKPIIHDFSDQQIAAGVLGSADDCRRAIEEELLRLKG